MKDRFLVDDEEAFEENSFDASGEPVEADFDDEYADSGIYESIEGDLEDVLDDLDIDLEDSHGG
jgi:hypothetical protein